MLLAAEAEAHRIADVTNEPIAVLGAAKAQLDRADGYFGARPPSAADEAVALRAEVERRAAALRPAVERHRRARDVAGLARALVATTFGEGVHGFASPDRTTRSWAAVAERAAEAAAERARRELSTPFARAA